MSWWNAEKVCRLLTHREDQWTKDEKDRHINDGDVTTTSHA